MLSKIKNWANNLEFWLAIITGLSLSIGAAPVVYVAYFQRVGWTSYSIMTHPGPLFGTAFGDQLCLANIGLLCAFPIITLRLVANYGKVKPSNFSRLWFLLPFVQFIWGLVNMLLLFWLQD